MSGTFLAGLQSAMDFGLRAGANVTGQSFDVYRLQPGISTGSIVQSGNLVIQNFKAFIARDEKHVETETNVIVKVPRFVFNCDASVLQMGDVLVQRGDAFRADESEPYNGDVFTFCYYRPLKRRVFMQTPIYGQVSRARNNPTAIDNGRVAYGAMSKMLEQFLGLYQGSYSWVPYGTMYWPDGITPVAPAVIPMGLVATTSRGELPPPNLRLPTDVKRQSWHVYFASLPGVTIFESHIMTGSTGDRYYVQTPFNTYVGLQGQQNVCEKLRV